MANAANTIMQLSAKAQAELGLPSGFKTYSPYPFAGMNLQSSPLAVDDKEFIYNENFLRLGDGYLRTAWDIGAAIYAATGARTIISFFFYTIGPSYYVVIFLSDGSAVQVNTSTLAVTTIGGAGLFYSAATGYVPAATQWGTQYLLISNRNTSNDYWAWDGAVLYRAGSAAPNGVNILSNGQGYNSVPTITAFGGHGVGMTFTPTVQSGGVVSVQITNPGYGYEPGDLVQLAFSGGGADSSAQLQAALSPQGVAAVYVSAGGSGYTAATALITGGGGSSATATVTVIGGVVTGISVTAPGSGYTTAPTVTISGDGVGATAVALLYATGVASVSVVAGGGGFTAAPNISFSGGGGAGATGIAVLTPTTVDHVNITAPGAGYFHVPTVAFEGGDAAGVGGIGALAGTALISNGQVVGVTITNAGSGIVQNVTMSFTATGGDTPTALAGGVVVLTATSIASVLVASSGRGYTTAPSVQVNAGANNSAYATVSLMPFGVSGSCLETFSSRVWLANPAPAPYGTLSPGGNWQVSAPGSFIDFATSDGGVLFTNSDRFLQTTYTAVRQSSGYLYFFGDGSCSVVSNINTTGSPPTTVFTYQNVDPQAGCSWRDSLQDFGRSILFVNETGVFGLYGGSATKISKKLDKLFDKAVFPPSAGALTPSGAIATLFDVKHYFNLMTITDPDTELPRNVMVTWNESEWSITSQSAALTYIGTQKIESKFYAWGTDGTKLYPLFAAPSATLEKRLDLKQYGTDAMFLQKELLAFYMQAQDNLGTGIDMSVDFSISGLAVQDPENPTVASGLYSNLLLQPVAFSATPPAWPLWGTGATGDFITVSTRLTTTSPDFSIGNLVIGWKNGPAFYA